MPEANETKITFVIPCVKCRNLNRLEATFKAAPVIEKPEAKPEAEKPEEAEKDGGADVAAGKGERVRPDKGARTDAKDDTGDKPADRKAGADNSGKGAK